MKSFHRSIQPSFCRTFFTLNRSAEARLELELAKKESDWKDVVAKKDVELVKALAEKAKKESDWKDVVAKKDVELVKALAKKDFDWKDVVAKKDVELVKALAKIDFDVAKKDVELVKALAKKESDWKDVVAEKDVKIAVLNEKLKNSNMDKLMEKQAYSIRAAMETLLLKKYPEKPRKMEEKLKKYWEEDPQLKETYLKLCEKFNCSNYAHLVPSRLYHSLSSKIHGGGFPIKCNIKDSSLSAAEWSFVIAVFKENLPNNGFIVFDSEDNQIDIDTFNTSNNKVC